MQAPHEMPRVLCRTNCQHLNCQRNNALGTTTAQDECKCQAEANAASTFLENVLDFAKTLAQVMVSCGIHECKAKATVDIVTYAFLHYDQYCFCLQTKPKKCLRKDDLFQELGKRCLMSGAETHLAYNIIKRGFSAFYYEPDKYDPSNPDRPLFSEECAYIHAAKKTARHYARHNGLPCEEQRKVEDELKLIYRKYCDRLKQRRNRKAAIDEDCNCCFCAKERGDFVYSRVTPRTKVKKSCPGCCPKKTAPPVQLTRMTTKCPICKRPRRFCTCEKYQFNLEFVNSIWDRADFKEYYTGQIACHQPVLSEHSFRCDISTNKITPSGSKEGTASKPVSGKTSQEGTASKPLSQQSSQEKSASKAVSRKASQEGAASKPVSRKASQEGTPTAA